MAEMQVSHEILCDLANWVLEGQFLNQKLRALSVKPDFLKRNSSDRSGGAFLIFH